MAGSWRRFLEALGVFGPFLFMLIVVYGYIELIRFVPLLRYAPISVLLFIALMFVSGLIVKLLQRARDSTAAS